MVLSEDVVVSRAASVAMRDGLAGVALRSVARELDVTPMALYRHVGDAARLRAVVVERLLSDLPDVAGSGGWAEQCRAWAFAARRVIARTPGLAQLVLVDWIRMPRVLGAVESLVGLFEDEGPAGCDAVGAANAVLMHVLMRAEAEEVVHAGGVDRDLSVLRAHRRTCPRLWRRRDEYRVAQIDRHFAYGLDALLAGLSASPPSREAP